MSCYDFTPKGDQIKCFECEFKHYKEGMPVPKLSKTGNYAILLREGGYIQVENSVIKFLVEDGVKYKKDRFLDIDVFDKWGNLIKTDEDFKGTGLLGEDYYKEQPCDKPEVKNETTRKKT